MHAILVAWFVFALTLLVAFQIRNRPPGPGAASATASSPDSPRSS